MKLNKIFALAVAGLTMVSCSNDKEVVTFNTLPGATVEMGEPNITVKENRGLFSVPINVAGERNGCVTVTVEVKEVGENPAIEDANFFITTKTVNIPANMDQFDLEISTKDFNDVDPDYTFEIEISNVKYATQSGRLSTLITIVDKGVAPLADALPTNWDCSAFKDADLSNEVTWSSSLNVVPEGSPVGDGDEVSQYPILNFSDWMGESRMTCPMEYRYDFKINWADFYIPFGTAVASNVNFTDLGVCDIVVCSEGGSGVGEMKGSWNDDFTAVSFAKNAMLMIWQGGKSTGYYYSYMNGLSMKVKE